MDDIHPFIHRSSVFGLFGLIHNLIFSDSGLK